MACTLTINVFTQPSLHGGPGPAGPARHDFSVNSHAAGPCASALAAVQAADATRYPDAGYHALRQALATRHGVLPERVLLAASASEFIQRISAVGARLAPGPVAVPAQAYGDYALAARAHGRLLCAADDSRATLRWVADPSSPLGQDAPPLPVHLPASQMNDAATVLDAVYAPLRLSGRSAWNADSLASVFVLHSPNKALGLCGVRGAYVVAPAGTRWQPWLQALQAAAPSWALGAHGVALLQAWCSEDAQAWLQASLQPLRQWKAAQQAALQARGIELAPSHTPFFCVRPRQTWRAPFFAAHGVQLRDASSFGLPGWWRLNTLTPVAQAALLNAIDSHPA
jgi:histidinol-phosphate aminotransferase